MTPLENTRVNGISQIITPKQLKEVYPVSTKLEQEIITSREIISNIVNLQDPRLLVITGPCSIHDTQMALEIANNLVKLKEKYPYIYPIMRVYFEKPRTTVGWKGLINDPHLNGTHDIEAGLKMARKLLLDINELGLPTATEFLDTISPQYLSDLIHWGAIGARTTESQLHRELVSGLSMPVGFKNGTSGDIDFAINSILSSQEAHTFLGATKDGNVGVIATTGNADSHIILRGGKTGPNYSERHTAEVSEKLENKGINKGIIVDASHANSNKDHNKQANVVDSIAKQVRNGNHRIIGVMLESNIEEGNQAFTPGYDDPEKLEYGKSITDACISLKKNRKLMGQLNEAVKIRVTTQ